MKRVVLIYVLLSFILLTLLVFTGYNVYYLISYISFPLSNIYFSILDSILIRYATLSLLGCCSIAANIIIMVLLRKIPASKLAMDTEKEKRIKKLEAKIERLKSDDRTNT